MITNRSDVMSYIPGQRVRTNKTYYQKNERRIIGEIVSSKINLPEDHSIVRWIEQSGKTIEEFNGTMVIMSNNFLEPY